ncbi:membrane-bound PQQ-dependent dehydrogenase, glucose/quinate/shikimate family, partial [Bordetella hinzii]|nr:membrane-bound PQQ-dependent dehydrogenase, glucose/quinate/shikimate family [Bordetella hinzii]
MAPSPYRPPWYVTLFGIVLALIGLALAVGGARLVSLSGSWYYLLAGLGMLAAGILLARRRPLGAWVYALVFVGTVIWAFWEVGRDFWQLVPRLIGPIVLALVTLLVWPALHEGGARSRVRRNAYPLAGVAVLALIGFG